MWWFPGPRGAHTHLALCAKAGWQRAPALTDLARRRQGLGPPGWQSDVTAAWWATSCPAQGWFCLGPWIQWDSRLQLFLQRKGAGTFRPLGNKNGVWKQSRDQVWFQKFHSWLQHTSISSTQTGSALGSSPECYITPLIARNWPCQCPRKPKSELFSVLWPQQASRYYPLCGQNWLLFITLAFCCFHFIFLAHTCLPSG